MFFKKWWASRRKKKQNKLSNHYYSSGAEKTYIPADQLTVGMFIVELDRPWLETPFLFQGFEVKTQAEINAVKSVCKYVYIDRSYKKRKNSILNSARLSNPKVLNHNIAPKKLGAFEQEISRAEKIYSNTEVLVADFMKKAARGGEIDGWLAKQAIAECVNSVLYSPDAMLWLTQLKNKDEQAVQHSLNVCILSIILGRHLNFSEKDLGTIGLCGMMHDIGKMMIPLEILNKPGKLEMEEMQIMQSHTTLGYELLKSSEHMHPSAIETALSHHKRLDGKGYPRQINDSGCSDFSKIVAVADMYDAITSESIYQKNRPHLEAIHTLTEAAGTHLDETLVIKFIESLGVYPPGCLVIMTNGAIAMVIEVNEKIKLRPKIIILLDEDKTPVPEQIMDLSEMTRDKKGDLYVIRDVIRAEDWNIDSSKYYQQRILQKGYALIARPDK